MYLNDIFTVPANLAGVPAMSFPAASTPAGCRSACSWSALSPKATLLDVAHGFQQATDWHSAIAERRRDRRRAQRRSGSGRRTIGRGAYEVVIGLETHAQLSTASKIFSGASTAFGAAPNTQASAVDIALPGVLPVLNRGAVERAIRFGLAVGATITPAERVRAQELLLPRPAEGLPDLPVRDSGRAGRRRRDRRRRRRRIASSLTRAHLEEDAGKSLHGVSRTGASTPGRLVGIDLNRAGTPLLEIVSEPDMR